MTDTGNTDSAIHRAVKMANDRLSSSVNAFRNLRILSISSSSGFIRYLYLCSASLVSNYEERGSTVVTEYSHNTNEHKFLTLVF